ncbi:unnamed protein product [Leptidea sinapis]|uniref:Uncharacterized protein n=1 Tax=Leptidea sinapis TaxID=189913 RepID=A0A5E4QUP3_9NEOP|nr:unnamed protein product [Leptidea sinapis]
MKSADFGILFLLYLLFQVVGAFACKKKSSCRPPRCPGDGATRDGVVVAGLVAAAAGAGGSCLQEAHDLPPAARRPPGLRGPRLTSHLPPPT